MYRSILEADPDHVKAHGMLGILAAEMGQPETGALLVGRALDLCPNDSNLAINLGQIYKQMCQCERALACFGHAVRVNPNSPAALYTLGVELRDQDRLDEAAEAFQCALALNPEWAEARFCLGGVYHRGGLLEQAEAEYCHAVRIDPAHARAWKNIGLIAGQRGLLEDALAAFEKMSSLRPDQAEPYFHMAETLFKQGRTEESIPEYRKAVELAPDFSLGFYRLGMALESAGQMGGAADAFRQAAEIDPELADAHFQSGLILYQTGNFRDAADRYQRVLDRQPENHQAWHNLGNAFVAFGAVDQALSAYRRALDIKPDLSGCLNALTFELRGQCDWTAAASMADKLRELTTRELEAGQKPGQTPFLHLITSSDPERHLAIARSWSHTAKSAASGGDDFKHTAWRKGERLTIGYISGDFRNHPIAQQTLELYGLHDRNRFRVHCYSYGPDDGSEYRARIASDCDRFVDLRELSDRAAAETIFKDEVDVLVDLTGHTGDNRMPVLAHKPAPVQVSYLGYLGTSGSDFIQYFITDEYVTPHDTAKWYSEKFVFMPHCYQIQNREPAPIGQLFTRRDFGLPEEKFVFCSFNSGYKIEPAIFHTWMRILKKTPGAVLWLLRHSPAMENFLKKEAVTAGIDPGRLVFANRVPLGDHLARLKLADLALDTWIYNGGATTANALKAGLPVLTSPGSHLVSRMTAGHLMTLGLTGLITPDLDQYEELAVGLAGSPSELKDLRGRLLDALISTPLFDTPRFVRNLETAYETMVRLHENGEPPRQIRIESRSNAHILS